jgi:hypothetical protein
MLRANAQLLAGPANARAPRPHAATMERTLTYHTDSPTTVTSQPTQASTIHSSTDRRQQHWCARCKARLIRPHRQDTAVRTQKTATTHSCAHAEDSHNPQLCARRRQPQHTAVRTQTPATTHSCAHAEDSHSTQLCARRRQPQPTAVRTQKVATTHSCAHAALGRMARNTYLIRSLRLQRRSEVGCAIHRHGGACTPQKMANHKLTSELASLLALTPRDTCPFA